MLHTHCMRVDSDLRRLNEWWQYPGIAMTGSKTSKVGWK
jgi:hypothetical protein